VNLVVKIVEVVKVVEVVELIVKNSFLKQLSKNKSLKEA
jgi:hypothetical protein